MKLGNQKTLKYCNRIQAVAKDIHAIHADLTNDLERGGPNQLAQVGDDFGEAQTALSNALARLAAIEGYQSVPLRIWQRLSQITIGPT